MGEASPAPMEFGLLGPFLVRRDGDLVAVPRGKQRAVLATLLLNANQLVPIDELADALWGESQPPSAEMTIRNYVKRMRRTLGETSGRISTGVRGYSITVEPSEIDIARFEGLALSVRASVRDGRWDRVPEQARAALSLWRGDPLSDVGSRVLADRETPRLAEIRLQVLEARFDADVRSGAHADVIPELRRLVRAHPLREHLHATLMTALYRCGRQGDALEAYRDARRTLVAELGVEPGAELRVLHERMLAADPALDLSGPTRTVARDIVPRQLPSAIRHFVGRASELAALTAIVERTGADRPTALVISAIAGTAGVGKTTLAVHWAHRHADLFPDGQLYVNLRGFDPTGPPVAAASAVRRMLDALTVPVARIPADTDAQFDLYRSLVANRRLLIILDNASDAEQVRPLLPGAAGCTVLITSRNRLTSLIALDGALPLTLDLLTTHEARELLTHRLGAERVLGEHRAVDELIETSARLPLALNIAAAHAATNPTTPLRVLADQLRDTHRRLDLLSTGHAAANLRAVFSWSYQTLSAPAAHLFDLVGLHPGPDISLPAAASLAAGDCGQTQHALDELTAAHLLTEQTPGRYGMHDLLRAYAAEQAMRNLSTDTRTAALNRLVDCYLHTAHAADRLLQPVRDPIRLEPPTIGSAVEPPADMPQARAWFGAEHACLLAVRQLAVSQKRHTAVWQLAWTLNTFHERQGRDQDNIACWRDALIAADQLGDPTARGLVRERLGRAHALAGRSGEALDQLRQAMNLAEQAGDARLQAHIHSQLALTWEMLGQDRQALPHHEHGLRLYRALGDRTHEARALSGLAWTQARVGDYDSARDTCEQALELGSGNDDRIQVAAVLDTLGYIAHHTGRHAEAIGYYRRALLEFRALGSDRTEADIHSYLGDIHAALGNHTDAGAAWQRALDIYRAQHRTTDAERVQHKLLTGVAESHC